jgi:hypothetical protein
MKRLLKHIFKKNTFTHHLPMARGPILPLDRVIALCRAPPKNLNPGHIPSSLLVRGISSCFVASLHVAPLLLSSHRSLAERLKKCVPTPTIIPESRDRSWADLHELRKIDIRKERKPVFET